MLLFQNNQSLPQCNNCNQLTNIMCFIMSFMSFVSVLVINTSYCWGGGGVGLLTGGGCAQFNITKTLNSCKNHLVRRHLVESSHGYLNLLCSHAHVLILYILFHLCGINYKSFNIKFDIFF